MNRHSRSIFSCVKNGEFIFSVEKSLHVSAVHFNVLTTQMNDEEKQHTMNQATLRINDNRTHNVCITSVDLERKTHNACVLENGKNSNWSEDSFPRKNE